MNEPSVFNGPEVSMHKDVIHKTAGRAAVPLTSRADRVYRCEAIVSLNGEMRKAMADQNATVSKLT